MSTLAENLITAVKSVAALAGAGCIALLGALYAFQRKLIFAGHAMDIGPALPIRKGRKIEVDVRNEQRPRGAWVREYELLAACVGLGGALVVGGDGKLGRQRLIEGRAAVGEGERRKISSVVVRHQMRRVRRCNVAEYRRHRGNEHRRTHQSA